MYVFISILILLCSILLVLIVLVQNSKGGGLASGFSSSNQVLGVRKTTDFLEKATWTLAGLVIVLCIGLTSFIPRGQVVSNSEVIDNVSAPANIGAPDFGNTLPADMLPGSETAPAQESAPQQENPSE
jgi:protein translocase, SecG subunit